MVVDSCWFLPTLLFAAARSFTLYFTFDYFTFIATAHDFTFTVYYIAPRIYPVRSFVRPLLILLPYVPHAPHRARAHTLPPAGSPSRYLLRSPSSSGCLRLITITCHTTPHGSRCYVVVVASSLLADDYFVLRSTHALRSLPPRYTQYAVVPQRLDITWTLILVPLFPSFPLAR